MKKVVRMLGLCALVALAFTACKKDDTQKVTFTANTVQTSSDARTHAAYGAYLVWNDGDVIQILNGAGTEMPFPALTSAGLPGVAQFTAETEDEVNFVKYLNSAKYTAFYPNATVSDEEVTMVIPAEQEYVLESQDFDDELYPMYGWNINPETGAYTDRFQFYSNAGFLNVSFNTYGGEIIPVDEVVLTSKDDDDFLSCNLVYDKEGQFLRFEPGANQITIKTTKTGPQNIESTQARDFTFVLPEGALWSGFTVDVKMNGQTIETYDAQPNVDYIIEAQKYTIMSRKPLPNIPDPTGK